MGMLRALLGDRRDHGLWAPSLGRAGWSMCGWHLFRASERRGFFVLFCSFLDGLVLWVTAKRCRRLTQSESLGDSQDGEVNKVIKFRHLNSTQDPFPGSPAGGLWGSLLNAFRRCSGLLAETLSSLLLSCETWQPELYPWPQPWAVQLQANGKVWASIRVTWVGGGCGRAGGVVMCSSQNVDMVELPSRLLLVVSGMPFRHRCSPWFLHVWLVLSSLGLYLSPTVTSAGKDKNLSSPRVFWCSTGYMHFSEWLFHGCWHLLEWRKSELWVDSSLRCCLGRPSSRVRRICTVTRHCFVCWCFSPLAAPSCRLQKITLVAPKLCPTTGHARNLASNTARAHGLQMQCFILTQVAFHLVRMEPWTLGLVIS